MTSLSFDLASKGGKIKPMNAVNNGPTDAGVRKVATNFDAYAEACIPYARTHDASFFVGYGGEHTVDVHRIFKDFSADENDPASYIFEPTDEYLHNILSAGTKVFYRLGASIEHRYKYGTRVPADMAKWARICEHIIRHYNEGWANGFQLGIEYWEIWNEPDCHNADGSNPCWQGTEEQFVDFYAVVSKHLKACFPDLKIGGPAFMSVWDRDLKAMFLDRVAKDNLPLDFFSYHWYGKTYERLILAINEARTALDRRGLTKTETILDEWNYVRGWAGEDWAYSMQAEKSLKGASFVLGAMCIGQALPLDMLMYYDARPCAMNGLFEANTYKPLKPYYSFLAFRELARLGTQIKGEYEVGSIYSCAATNGEESAVVLTYYNEDDTLPAEEVKVSFKNAGGAKCVRCYVLDEEHDLSLTREEIFTAEQFSLYLQMPLHATVMIKIENAEI